jgi:hypothetical protein
MSHRPQEMIDLVEEPIQSNYQRKSKSSAKSRSSGSNSHTHDMVPVETIEALNLLTEFDQKSILARSPDEIFGFALPPKINRRIPLQTKGSDPCLCLDIFDDMYAIYDAEEVGDNI